MCYCGPADKVLVCAFLHGLPTCVDGCRRHGVPKDKEGPWWKNSGFLSDHMRKYSLSNSTPTRHWYLQSFVFTSCRNYGGYVEMQHNLKCGHGSGCSSSSSLVPRHSHGDGHQRASAGAEWEMSAFC